MYRMKSSSSRLSQLLVRQLHFALWGAAILLAWMGCSSAATADSQSEFFTVPYHDGEQWKESSMVIGLETYTPRDSEERARIEDTVGRIVAGISLKDLSVLAGLSESDSRERMNTELLERLQRRFELDSSKEYQSKVVELFETGNYIVAIVLAEKAGANSHVRVVELSLCKDASGTWLADWTNKSSLVRGVFGSIFAPLNKDGSRVSTKLSSLPEGLGSWIEAWPLGASSAGWRAVRLYFSAISLETGKGRTLLDAFVNHKKAIETVVEEECSPESCASFLKTIAPISRGWLQAEIAEAKENCMKWLVNYQLIQTPKFAISLGGHWLTVSEPDGPGKAESGKRRHFLEVCQFAEIDGSFMRADFGDLNPLHQLVRGLVSLEGVVLN